MHSRTGSEACLRGQAVIPARFPLNGSCALGPPHPLPDRPGVPIPAPIRADNCRRKGRPCHTSSPRSRRSRATIRPICRSRLGPPPSRPDMRYRAGDATARIGRRCDIGSKLARSIGNAPRCGPAETSKPGDDANARNGRKADGNARQRACFPRCRTVAPQIGAARQDIRPLASDKGRDFPHPGSSLSCQGRSSAARAAGAGFRSASSDPA